MRWGTTDLTVRFDGEPALDKVSVSIEPGVIHAVIGGDGAGKSTLLRVLAGLGLDLEGQVRLPPQERIGFVPSHGGVFGDLTVDENLAFIAAAYGLKNWQQRARELLERAAIDRFGDRLAAQLSGGQRRKLAGSMALLPEPQLLVLDEVTTGVDPVSRMELWRIVAGAAATGTAIVAATTYLDEAERAEQVVLLHNGCVLALGTPGEIIDGIPGTVTDESTPSERSKAWRHGRRWHQWHPPSPNRASGVGPTGSVQGGYRPSLEDAAIVHELAFVGASE